MKLDRALITMTQPVDDLADNVVFVDGSTPADVQVEREVRSRFEKLMASRATLSGPLVLGGRNGFVIARLDRREPVRSHGGKPSMLVQAPVTMVDAPAVRLQLVHTARAAGYELEADEVEAFQASLVAATTGRRPSDPFARLWQWLSSALHALFTRTGRRARRRRAS